MPNVEFTLSGKEDARLVDQLNKMERTIQSLQGKLDHTGKAGSKAFGDIDGELKKVVSSMMGPVGLAGAVAAVTSQLKSAYDLMIQNRQLANQSQLNIGQARTNALLNLPPDFEGGAASLDAMIGRIAKQSGLSRAGVYQAASTGLSAKGSASGKDFEQAMTLASTIEARSGGKTAAGDVVGSLLDLRKVTGIGDANANLGWLRQSGAAARITSLQGQMRMIPGIMAAKGRGDTPEQAMELQAAVSQMIGDDTGERSSTGFVDLIQSLQVDELSPYYKSGKSGKKELKFNRIQGKNTYERIANLQQVYASAPDELKLEIQKKLGGRAGMQAFNLGMLANTEEYQNTLQATQGQIGAPDISAAEQAQEFLQNTFSGVSGQVLKSNIQTEQMAGSIQAANPKRAMEQQAWEKYKTVTSALNIRPGAGFMYDINSMIGGAFNKEWNLADTLSDRVGELSIRGGISAEKVPALQELQKSLNELSETIKKLDRNIQVKDTNNPSSQELDQ